MDKKIPSGKYSATSSITAFREIRVFAVGLKHTWNLTPSGTAGGGVGSWVPPVARALVGVFPGAVQRCSCRRGVLLEEQLWDSFGTAVG